MVSKREHILASGKRQEDAHLGFLESAAAAGELCNAFVPFSLPIGLMISVKCYELWRFNWGCLEK